MRRASRYTARMKTTHTSIIGLGLLFLTLFSGCAPDNNVKVLYSNESPEPDKIIRWHESGPGLSYANVLAGFDDDVRMEFFVVRVDPREYEFRVVTNESDEKAKSIKQIHTQEGSVLSFNGAFFDTNFKAMGLLQDSKHRVHKMLRSDLMNGIFYTKCGTVPENLEAAELMELKDYVDVGPDKHCGFWIQNGPILIDNIGGIRIDTDSGKSAARTALGIDGAGNVVLIVLHQSLLNTDNALSLYQFAHMLKEHEPFAALGLHSVLNLDGGPSTGVAVGGEYIPEIKNVQNVIITVPKDV